MRDPGAGDTKESRKWVPPPGGAVVDREAVHLVEAKRMRENKMNRFVFLKETEDININVGPQYKTDAKMIEVNETAQLEELYELDFQGETSKLEELSETRPGEELQAVLEETENININGGPQCKTEARTTGGNETSKLEELSKKHPGDKLQAAMPTKRVKTKDGVRTDLDATAHSAAMEQETNTPRKTCDKGYSQDVDRTSTFGQGEE